MKAKPLIVTMSKKILKHTLRFLLSLSWSNITFLFCLYVFFDAIRAAMHLARRQNSKLTNNGSAVEGTTTRNGQSATQQRKRHRKSDKSKRGTTTGSSRDRNQATLRQSDPPVAERPPVSPTLRELSSDVRNCSNDAMQEPVINSSPPLSCSNLPDKIQDGEDDKNGGGTVKRYISLFSGMNSTNATPSSRRSVGETTSPRDMEPSSSSSQDRRDDIHDDQNDEVFLGDVDERRLRCDSEAGDAKLSEMTNVLSKRLVGVSIREFFDTCWAAEMRNGSPSFYQTWLQRRGYTKIVIYDWEYAVKDGDLRGRWCGENYTQRRLVSYKYRRTTDLHCGSLDAEVRQVQMCRLEGKDKLTKLVVRMRTDTRGIPFADCFQTETRVVATQVEENVILVKVGVFVDFLKPVVLAGKLQTELIRDVANEQLDFFKSLKKFMEAQVVGTKQNREDFNLPVAMLNFLKQWDQK